MKRSPLSRKTPLKRSGKLRPVSKKRAKLQREVSGPRAAYVKEQGRCAVCGATENLAVHEIAKGSHREAALSEEEAWLVACWTCNSGPLNDYSLWPIERQLALKALCDAERYDRRKVNELRGRAPEAINEAEVISAAYELGRAAWNR